MNATLGRVAPIDDNPYRAIAENAADGIVVVGDDGRVRFLNRAAAALFRRPIETLQGQLFGFPVAAGETTELDILQGDGAATVAEMRVTAMHWHGLPSHLALLRDIGYRKQLEIALRESEYHYRMIMQEAQVGIFVLDADGRFLDANPQGCALLGLDCRRLGREAIAELLGAPADYLPVPLERLRVDEPLRSEGRVRRRDGALLPVEVSAVRLDNGRTIALLQDISGRKQSEEARELSQKVFENTQEGILITDTDGVILTVNQAFTELTGYTAAEVLGQNPRLLRSGRQDAAFYRRMWNELFESGQWRGEIWNRRKNGEIYPEWINISAVHDAAGRISHFVAVFSDITQVKHHEEQLEQLAYYDTLTGLPNRFLIQDRLGQAIAQAERRQGQVAVLFLDLDRFKPVNDTLGHKAGDALLVEVGRRLGALMRKSDTVGRFGGDEFVVILGDLADTRHAGAVATKILDRLAAPYQIAGHEIYVSASIGIGVYPENGDRPDLLIRAADMAMYEAKTEGRAAYRFFHGAVADERLSRRFLLEHQLRAAAERGQLRLHYQPLVELDNGTIGGVEALLRWHHPELGLLPPDDFIPLAEETGVIVGIGEWVLREACERLVAWRQAGVAPLRIAVNVSPVQLRQRDFVQRTRAILDDYPGVAPWLEFELTESSLIQDPDETAALLRELKGLGLRIAIDDFGTGYSALGYLRQLPVDSLKVARTFVAGLADQADDRAIALTIIALARNLHLKVVAEGVETHGQLAFLRDHRCRTVQGYYFSRPLPEEELLALLRGGAEG